MSQQSEQQKKAAKKVAAQKNKNAFDTANYSSRPVISIEAGELPRMYDQAEVALAATGRVYQRGGVLVGLTDDFRTVPLNAATVNMLLARCAAWTKIVKMKDREISVPADPPRGIAEALVAAPGWPVVDELRQVVRHPVFLPDGRLLEPGFDRRSGFYGAFAPLFDVRDDATLEEALEAAAQLETLLHTFDFETHEDRAASLSAILAAVCRPVLRTAPMFLISAPLAGTGKGLLARVISRFAVPGEPSAATLPDDDDEAKKEIMSRLMSSQPVLFFDEVAGGEIDSVPLRTLATSEIMGGRLLGQSRDINLSTRTLVLITGNNITPTADTARRIVEIRLNPACETPATRTYTYNPITVADRDRINLIRAALTIQAAWIAAGRPRAEGPAVGSFGDWDEWCRQPIIWLTGTDPATRMFSGMLNDPRKNELATVLAAWYARYDSQPVNTGDMCGDGSSQALQNALRDATSPRNGQLSPKSVGRWLARNRDRIAAGFKLVEAGMLDGRTRWRVDRAN